MASTSPGRPLLTRSIQFAADNVVIGGGAAAGTILGGFARSRTRESVLAITSRERWPEAFRRHHLLGQSRKNLTLFPGDFHDPRGRMSVEEHMREVADYQTQAVEQFQPDKIDCLETRVTAIRETGDRGKLLVMCTDGSRVLAGRVFLATGVGPERTLERSGVVFTNTATPKRLVFHEATTALKSMEEQPGYWKNKKVAVYGGGPTAAWVVETAMEHPLRDILWLSKDGFQGANPGNRNSETLRLTERHRITAPILQMRYQGGGDIPPDEDGLELKIEYKGKAITAPVDIAVCATGSDPMAPTGVQSVLKPLYGRLRPVRGEHNGIYACLPEGSLYVVSSALSYEREIQKLIQEVTFPVLNPENRVVAGLAVSQLSALDAIEAALRQEPSTQD